MSLSDLLTRATMLSAPIDTTRLDPLRARLFEQWCATGWAPAGHERGRASRAGESDERLLLALGRGDAAAFDALFDRHAARLNGHARRWLQSADAEDAVQDAFFALFQKGAALLEHPSPNVAAYLFATLRHKVRDKLASREIPVEEAMANHELVDEDALSSLLRREDGARLAQLLDRACSPLEQDVVMFTLEDRSGPEIAAELHITEGHARVVRHRAFAKLRHALSGEAP